MLWTFFQFYMIEVTIKTFTVLGFYGCTVMRLYGYTEVTISPHKHPYNRKTV